MLCGTLGLKENVQGRTKSERNSLLKAEVHTLLKKVQFSPPDSKTFPGLSRLNLSCKIGQHKAVSHSAGGSRLSVSRPGACRWGGDPPAQDMLGLQREQQQGGNPLRLRGPHRCLQWESECLGQQEVFGVLVSLLRILGR